MDRWWGRALRFPGRQRRRRSPRGAPHATTPSQGRRCWWRRAAPAALVVVLALWVAATATAGVYDLLSTGTVAAPALDAHGHYVRTGDVVTHYEQWGEHGSPIVLVHGFLESAWVWGEVAPLLAAHHRIYAPDIRGYGYTQRRGPYTLAADTEQVAAFLAAVHLDARHSAAVHEALPVLVGHSSGAAIVGNVARLHPQQVSAVVFIDGDGTPYGVGPGWVHRLFVDPYATALIRWVTRHPGLAAGVYRNACGPGCPPFDARAWLSPFRLPGAVAALRSILNQQLIGLSYAQEQQIRVRATVIRGATDPELTGAGAQATARRLHTGRVITIPGAKHLPMLSAPQRLAAALMQP